MDILKWIFFGLFMNYACDAYRILVVFPIASKSHGILGTGIVRHLLDAGHEVTYITPFLVKDPHPKLHQVDVTANLELVKQIPLSIELIMDKKVDFSNHDALLQIMTQFGINTVQNENVQKLLQDDKTHFDVVIAEWMFSQLYSSFSAVFDCPLMWFSTLEPHWMFMSLIDDRLHPAYNTDFKNSHLPPFTFSQRVQELWNQISGEINREFKYFGLEEKVYETHIAPILSAKGKIVPSYKELMYNASLTLGNSHVSLGQAATLPQSYKPIGGYHIETDVKPLPEDLKKIMDNAKNGVIYFSMGSNLQSKDWPVEVKKQLLKMFGDLKYTVLWKFEEALPNLPKNVHILQWAPQQSILAHPKCVLFITHGGLLSTTEATHFGVPIIGVPAFADQFSNVNRAANKGFARKVDLTHGIAEELKIEIQEILGNSKYAEKAKQLSFIYHHRPVSPAKELLHWVDHVVQTNGALHLRSCALQVPFYQKMYLDLFAVVLILIILLTIVLKRIMSEIKFKINLDKKVK